MAEKVKSINLIPNKGNGLLDQFLNWALTIGRLLIILTETLALGTFLYRFSIDMKIVDYHDLIKQQSQIVEGFNDTEATARDLQSRLAFAKKSDAQSGIAPGVFADIIEIGRGSVTFKNLLVSTNSIKIEIQAPSTNSLSFFVNELKKYPGVTAVSVEGIENKTSLGIISMTIAANLKTGGTK